MNLLLLFSLALPAWSQSTTTAANTERNILHDTQLDSLDISMRELQSGRPTLTSTPTFRSSIIVQGITFPDGTTQTSGNSFSSTVTINSGITAYTHNVATASYAAVLKGSISQIAAASATTQGSIYFYGFNSTFTTTVEFNFAQVTSNGDLGLRFNDDTGNDYSYVMSYIDTSGNHAIASSASTSRCILTGSRSVRAGDSAHGWVKFASGPTAALGNRMLAHWEMAFHDGAANTTTNAVGSCEWNLAASYPNRFLLVTSAGTMTGFFDAYAQVPLVAHQ